MRRGISLLLPLLLGLGLPAHSQKTVGTSPIEVSPVSGISGAAPAVAPLGLSSLSLAPLGSSSLSPSLLLPGQPLPKLSAPALQTAEASPLQAAGRAAPLALPKSVVAVQTSPGAPAAALQPQVGVEQAQPRQGSEKPGVVGKLEALSEDLAKSAEKKGGPSGASAEQGDTLSKFWEHGHAGGLVQAEAPGHEAYPYRSGPTSAAAARRVIEALDRAIAPDGRARAVGVLVLKSGEILVGLSGKAESLGAPDFLEAISKVKAELGPGYVFADLDSGIGRKEFKVPKTASGERIDNPFCAEKKLFKDFREGRRSLGDIAEMAVLWRGPGENIYARPGDARQMLVCQHCAANAALIQGRK